MIGTYLQLGWPFLTAISTPRNIACFFLFPPRKLFKLQGRLSGERERNSKCARAKSLYLCLKKFISLFANLLFETVNSNLDTLEISVKMTVLNFQTFIDFELSSKPTFIWENWFELYSEINFSNKFVFS